MPSVGYKALTSYTVDQAALPLHFLYPANAVETPVRIGPYEFSAAVDSDPVDGDFPLVAISHGSGSTPWVHRDLARHLAFSGFIVVMPDHVGNSRTDDSLAGTEAALVRRPAQLSAAIEIAQNDANFGPRLRSRSVGLIGTSIGAYTALAVAGGRPWTSAHESATGVARPIDTVRRSDIGAIVLLSPAAYWFTPEGTLDEVNAPVLIRNGSKDQLTPPSQVELIRERLPARTIVSHKCIDNAGHFSFMSVFPPSLAQPGFPPAQDPIGFDRLAYQAELQRDVAAFFGENLA